MRVDAFHPQVRQLLNLFQRYAPTFLLQWHDPKAQTQSTSRPVTIVESVKFNASVGRAPDGYAAYSVTAGAIAAIYDISRTLSATPSFVSQIPVTGKTFETRTYRSPAHFLDYSELIGSLGQPIPLIPLREIFEDPPREALGFLVFGLSMRFLVMHEQMHFIRGHLHYVFGADSPGAYDEIPQGARAYVPNQDSKALELDADGSALAFLFELYDQAQHRALIDEWAVQFGEHNAAMFRDRWGWARIAALSAQIVMLLLSLSDSPGLSHPTIQTRMLNLLGTQEHYLRNRAGLSSLSAPPPSLLHFFADVATVATTLHVRPPDPKALIEWKSIEPEHFRHPACIELRDLQERLRSLSPKLR